MRIVVAGAGLAGRRLIARLSAGRHDVVAVDLNREICELVSSKLGAIAICGNATDVSVLEEAEIERSDVAVALMRQSADNLAFSLLAKGAGVKRIISRMPNPKYRQAYEYAGVTSIIDVVGLFLEQLLLEIEHPGIHQLVGFASGNGVVATLKIPRVSRGEGKSVQDIATDRRFPEDCVIAGLVRGRESRFVTPGRTERILAGDQVLLCGTPDSVTKAADYLQVKKGLLSFGRSRREPEPCAEERLAQLEMDEAVEDKTDSEQGTLEG